jgi:hypothetical protein
MTSPAITSSFVKRKIAEGWIDKLGDTSTLADPSVVTQLVDERL